MLRVFVCVCDCAQAVATRVCVCTIECNQTRVGCDSMCAPCLGSSRDRSRVCLCERCVFHGEVLFPGKPEKRDIEKARKKKNIKNKNQRCNLCMSSPPPPPTTPVSPAEARSWESIFCNLGPGCERASVHKLRFGAESFSRIWAREHPNK